MKNDRLTAAGHFSYVRKLFPGFNIGLRDQINGATLGLQIGFGKILSQYADPQHLNTAEQKDNAHKRRPAGSGVAKGQSSYNNDDNHHQSQNTAQKTQHRG